MATITVEDLNLAGSELLSDEESFLEDLSEDNLEQTYGGATPFAATALFIAAAGLGYKIGRDDRG